MTRKLFLLHLLCFCCLLSAQATGQISDLIIIGKDTFYIGNVPDRARFNLNAGFLHNESFSIVVSTPALRQLIYNKTNGCLMLATVATSADKLFISTVFFDIFTDFPI